MSRLPLYLLDDVVTAAVVDFRRFSKVHALVAFRAGVKVNAKEGICAEHD